MFRKFALATIAAVVGMVIADKLTAGQQHSSLFGLHEDCQPQQENEGAKGDRPLFTPTVAHSAR